MTFSRQTTITAILAVTIPLSLQLHKPSYPFQNVSLPWETRVDNLVSLLTLEELETQMSHGGHGPRVSPAPPIPRLGVGNYSWNTECLRGVVRAGPATSFPQALGLAASFSPELLFNVARATGLELHAKYNNYTKAGLYGDSKGLSCFAPVVNIMRDPRWGRNQETYGEDPILTSLLATAFIQGLQGNDSRYILANAGCKHFDVYGGPEKIPVSRFVFDAKVSDIDWHQTFLPAFKACVDAGTYSLMCSYNSINGVPACGNKKLLTDILRGQLGFKGYVISDAGALERMVTSHNYSKDFIHAAADAVNAGVSLEISKNILSSVMNAVVKAVNGSLLNETRVREMVKPLFYTRMRLGEFDPPSMNPYSNLDISLIQSPAHQALSLESAKKSFVLLKNKNNFLPIKSNFKHVAAVGPMTNQAIYGDYSPDKNTSTIVTPLMGLQHLAKTVTWAKGCRFMSCVNESVSDIKTAVAGSEIVFVFLGTSEAIEAESRDRADVELPGEQLQVLKDAVTYSNGAPVVLVLYNAGPVNVTWADQSDAVVAILECWFPAQTAGQALVDVLTNDGGISSPAGRLPYTWPLFADQIPDMVNYSMMGRTYRYSQAPSLYPFGYGLSYTTFHYSNLVTPKTLTAGQNLTLNVTVSNTGNITADEVVQVYIQWPKSNVVTPRLQLVAVKRLPVDRGHGVTLNFTVPAHYLAVYTDQGWTYLPGTMKVYAGGQQPYQRSVGSNVLSADVIVTKEEPVTSDDLKWKPEIHF